MHRSKREQAIRAAIISAIILVIMMAISTGCNSVQQVLKDDHKKEIVGRAWAKENPCVNDSVLMYQPGDTIVSVEYKEDTLFYYVNDTIRLPYGINKTHTINKFVHDSIKVVVRDKRAERILQDSVTHYFTHMKMYQGEAKAYKSKFTWWKIAFYALVVLLVIYIFRIKIFKLIRHLIPVPLP